MNKKVKFLSTALCALLLSSNVAAINVFAANTNTATSNTTVSYASSYSDDYEIAHFMWLNQKDAVKLAFLKMESNSFSEFGLAVQDTGMMTQTELKLFISRIWKSSYDCNDTLTNDGVCFIITTDGKLIFD